jgi:hypothetical protein
MRLFLSNLLSWRGFIQFNCKVQRHLHIKSQVTRLLTLR